MVGGDLTLIMVTTLRVKVTETDKRQTDWRRVLDEGDSRSRTKHDLVHGDPSSLAGVVSQQLRLDVDGKVDEQQCIIGHLIASIQQRRSARF